MSDGAARNPLRKQGRGRAARAADRSDLAQRLAVRAVDEAIEALGTGPGQLVGVLQLVQKQTGYLPRAALERAAFRLGLPLSQVYQVATFFTSLSLEPRGRNVITVCLGTACHVRGAPLILEAVERNLDVAAGRTTADGEFTLLRVGCVGACALGPIVEVNGQTHGHMKVRKAERLVETLKKAPHRGGPSSDTESFAAAPRSPDAERSPVRRITEQTGRTTRLSGPADLAAVRQELQAERLNQPKVQVALCAGTGCRACGCLKVADHLRSYLDREGLADQVELLTTGCHGFCEQGPILVIRFPEGRGVTGPDGRTFSDVFYPTVKVETLGNLLDEALKEARVVERALYRHPRTAQRLVSEGQVPFYEHQVRIVFALNGRIDPCRIEDYIARGGYSALQKALFHLEPEQVIEEVKASGLRGRGGGGFPAGVKWESCRRAGGDWKYVICNADEGDPGAFMDRSILEGNPHQVLEGMIIGAYAIGATEPPIREQALPQARQQARTNVEGYIYVRDEYPLAVHHVTRAVEQARQYGLLGRAILGSSLDFDVTVVRGGGAFVCGESTALMACLQGRAGEPRAKYVHTVTEGLWGRPSNLNNVETWANVPFIVNQGSEGFSSLGTERSKGTKIFSLVGKVRSTGLVEAPMGMTLRRIVEDIGGGMPEGSRLKAVQTGGPSGGCIPEPLLDLPVDFDELTRAGSMMGSGGLIVMDHRTCMVDVARYFVDFLLKESCGKCVPCRSGLGAMWEVLDRVCGGLGRPDDLAFLEELGGWMKEASLCGLGTSAANPVLSTLRYFRQEYEAHIDERRCPAGVCKELVVYSIVDENCNGCGACLKVCPVDAIAGRKKEIPTLDQRLCIKCGACLESCKFDAIERA